MRRDEKGELGSGFVPHAVIVARFHVKIVIAGSQVGVECHALVFVVTPPVVIVAIKSILEQHSLRRDETVGRVVDFKHAGMTRSQA